MTVLLVGAADDPQIDRVGRELERRGVEARRFDTGAWPGDRALTVEVTGAGTTIEVGDGEVDPAVGDGWFEPAAGDGKFDPAAYHTVYLRDVGLDPRYPAYEADFEERPLSVINQLREYRGVVLSIVRLLADRGARVINPPDAMSVHSVKPWQLATLSAAGIPVPDAVSTNDPETARAFAGRVDDAIYKPIGGGGHAHPLEPDDLTDERLSRLANSPVQFQERLRGEDVRVFVVDGEAVAAARIVADALDYRSTDHDVERISIANLDPAIADAAVRTADVLGLPFTGVDVIAGDDGFRVLEANPSPMFAAFDELAGTDVAGALADLLAEP